MRDVILDGAIFGWIREVSGPHVTTTVIGMRSTMQDIPLSLTRLLQHGASVRGTTKVTTWDATGGPSECTFRDIAGRAAALAHALEDNFSIRPGDRVATLMFNCAEHLEAMWAIPCMGAVFHPLNMHLMADQIQYTINHAADRVIIADPEIIDLLAQMLPHCPTVEAVVLLGNTATPEVRAKLPQDCPVYFYEELLDGHSTRFSWPALEETAPAAVCYSTGTTGSPKAVVYSHRSLYLQSMQLHATDSLALSDGESFLCGVPIYHVLSWGVPYAAFLAGTPLIFTQGDVSAAVLDQVISSLHPRVAHGVPSMWMQLLVYYLENPPQRMSLSEIYVGGAAAPPILISMWEKQYGVDVIQVWGMTETGIALTVARPPAGISGETRKIYRESQGRFCGHVEYRVINDGQVQANSDRSEGEIQIRGNLVTGSYYASPTATDPDGIAATYRGSASNDEASNAELFTSDGWLRTGDVGTVSADGFLNIHDRAQDVIRSGGEWIYSAQIENLIMDASEVIEAAIIGYPNRSWGERPLAITVLHEGIPPTVATAEKLREQLKDHLPAWMVPEYWTFVREIDKTSVGKFDKKDLRKKLAGDGFTIIELPGPKLRI